MLACLDISFWAAIKRKHHKRTNQALMKRWWCTLLEISTNMLLLPKELGLLQHSILQHMNSSGFQKLLPQGKQNWPAFLGRPGFKTFLQHTYQTRLPPTHEANNSLSTGFWKRKTTGPHITRYWV